MNWLPAFDEALPLGQRSRIALNAARCPGTSLGFQPAFLLDLRGKVHDLSTTALVAVHGRQLSVARYCSAASVLASLVKPPPTFTVRARHPVHAVDMLLHRFAGFGVPSPYRSAASF